MCGQQHLASFTTEFSGFNSLMSVLTVKTQHIRVPELRSLLTWFSFSEQVETSWGEGQRCTQRQVDLQEPAQLP